MKKNDKKIEKQETELENQLKRALADYQNLEKRIAQEKSSWIKTSNKDLILRLLPGIDSLLLAEKHTEDPGVKISIDHFLDILRNEGVEKIDTIGRNFDPELMEAVATKQGEEGKVLEEVKTGYTLSGRIIRPAQVIVGKKGN
ncbi:MAG: Protein GrpE [Candidatus Levybacteria bacterium GW2011_GWA2_36_13]|nr:MAG: Protein GrpE [Candidatus Levybacteria bacterium GW2011_GWA2_36_13]OGH44206.1 MAG: nucleotide exchange factor GrpE [Candidatus Levybacteria bacterium RIFCSPLOWO2_02_FULL_37_11]